MTRKTLLILITFLFPISPLQGNGCYSEYWQNIFWNMWENESFALGTFVRIETGNHLRQIRSIQLNEQLRYKASKDLSLEVHYAYLNGRSVVPDSPWRWVHRLELEANPIFQLPCNYLVITRNRFEIRKEEGDPKISYRLRQRTMLIMPFENRGRLKAYSIYNELFYNFTKHSFDQDRLCPGQLTFSLSDKVNLDIFVLVRFFTADHFRYKSAVLGTQFNF